MVNIRKQKRISDKYRYRPAQRSQIFLKKTYQEPFFYSKPCLILGSGGAEGQSWRENQIHSGMMERGKGANCIRDAKKKQKIVFAAEIQVR